MHVPRICALSVNIVGQFPLNALQTFPSIIWLRPICWQKNTQIFSLHLYGFSQKSWYLRPQLLTV